MHPHLGRSSAAKRETSQRNHFASVCVGAIADSETITSLDGHSMEKPKSVKLSVRSLRKAYGAVVALGDTSIDLAEGEFLTLLGPSGSGKTTLLMAIAG